MVLRNVAACCALLFLVAACTTPTGTEGEKAPETQPGAPETPEEKATGGGTGAAGTPGEKTAGDIRIGEPVTHKNLAIFPLYLASPEEVKEDYITLDEAVEKKEVQVKEEGEGGTVNAVEIENKSKQPLYILAGQIIIGGKQDRVITRDTIVPPGEKIQVEVCCVEHGRWSPIANESGIQFFAEGAYLNAQGQGSVRQLSQSGGVRAQGKVWDEVAKTAEKLKAKSSSGTYKEVLEKTKETVDSYATAMKAAFEKDKKICGFVACVNGKVQTCDLFASPKLLAMFRESLLRSYALDALYTGEAEEAKKATVAMVKDFLKEMQEARKNPEKLAEDKHRRVDKVESPRVIGFENKLKAGEALHMNAYSK